MAYAAKSLSRYGGVPYAAGDTKSKFAYATADALATVVASGYFNSATNRLRKGDTIDVMAALGGTPARAMIIVTSATGAATVTTAYAADAGGITGNLTAVTDSSGGTGANAVAAGVGKYVLPIHLNLAEIADGDLLTNYVLGHKFKILAVDFLVEKAVTTAAKAASLNLEIGTTNVTGGVVALTSANCTPKGAKVAGSAVTAANTGSASDTLSIEAASTTAFVEGSGWLLVSIQNMDTADAFATILARLVSAGLLAA